jgi:AAHS family 3-hydroxyphenylpropionic acid transporter
VPGWLAAPVVGAGLLAVLSGAAQFGVTAVLGEVALAFGAATTAEVEGQLGMSAGTLGLGLAVIRFAGAGSLFGSAVADRVGRRPVLLVATAAGLLLTLLAPLAPTFWVFVGVIALSRPLLSSTNAVTAVVAAEETDAHDRTAALAFIAAAYAAGSGIVSVARGAIDGLDFRVLLVVVGLFVVTVPVIARLVREPPANAHVAGAVRPAFGTVSRAVARPLVVFCLLAAATNLVTGPAFTFLFVYGENVLGASPARMALLVLAAGPAGLAGLLLGRLLADRLGRRVAALGGTLLIGLAGSWAYNGGQPALFAGYLVLIVAAAAAGPAAAALLNEAMPTETRATANGWAAAAGVVGAVAGLAAFGALAGDAGAFDRAALWLFLPLVPLSFGYLLLPETAGTEELPSTLDAADPVGTDVG